MFSLLFLALPPPPWLLQSPLQKKQKTPGSIISAENAAANSQLREIPVEIILKEILPRLPTKSLLRFKCVCKEWYSLISSTQFAKTHALHPSSLSSRSILSNDIQCLFEVVDYGDSSNLDFTQFRFHSSIDTDNYVIGSCHGLVLLISSDEECDYSLVHDFNFVVLNPVFSAVVEIDCPDQFLVRSFKNEAKDFSFGFGYSSIHDDYYIVAVSFPECSSYPMIVVYVYSLKTRKWLGNGRPRNYKQHRPSIVFQDAWLDHCAILVKETLHWGITIKKTLKCILAFDLGSQERFKTMELPYANFGEAGKDHSAFSLCCMDDCLCAWAYYEGGHVVEMWMMKEYGVQKSWTKLFRYKLRRTCKYFFGITKSKEVMLFHSDCLMILDFRSVPPKWVIKDLEDQFKAVNYVPSLLSPLAITSSEEGG